MTSSSVNDLTIWIAIPIFVSILITPILWLITFAHLIYITHKYVDEMTKAIKSSPDLLITIRLYDSGGMIRRILIPGLLHGAVFRTRSISIGLISLNDFENFPDHLKEKLSRDNFLFYASLLWTLGVFLALTAWDHFR